MSRSNVIIQISVICFVSTSGASGLLDTSAFESGKNCDNFRDDYSYEETTNTFYKLHRASVPWYDAVTWCKEEGTELALPTTDHEAQILLKYFAHVTHDVWLPFHDQFSEGIFISTNGTTLTEMYSNWLFGQPDDKGALGEDCVVMSQEGYYSDVACSEKNMFICKKININVFKDPLCLTYAQGYKMSDLNNRCYKVHPEPRNWHSAFRICEAEMAHLTDINSQAEAAYLVERMKEFPAKPEIGEYSYRIAHVDANELLSVNNYITRWGKTLQEAGYNTWYQNQPNKGNEHCGCIGRDDGKFYDIDCERHLGLFICEKDSYLSAVGSR